MPREKKTYAVRIAACEASEQRALAEAEALLAQVGEE